MIRRISLIVLLLAAVAACNPLSGGLHAISPIITVITADSSLATFTPLVTQTPIPSLTSTPTTSPTPTLTETPTPTNTPTPGPTATWQYHPPQRLTAPILLYHHVATDGGTENRYYISPDIFEQQMQALIIWGYTSITVSTLAEVLIQGGDLPARPVAITFDDGNEDIYTTAFPIMQRYGLVGTTYIVANRVGANGFLSADELKALAAAGWEIGSHSMSHIDITKNHEIIWQEVANSRIQLEHAIGVPVRSFAYPFGTTDETVTQKVQDYGYRNAVGLGTSTEHTWGTMYYLSREEVRASYDMAAFAGLLPWK